MINKQKPKAILIPFDNLTEREQLDLIFTIFHFAQDVLPCDKYLPLIIIPDNRKKKDD